MAAVDRGLAAGADEYMTQAVRAVGELVRRVAGGRSIGRSSSTLPQ